MAGEEHQGIDWKDLIIIGVSLFVANVMESILHIENKILAYAAFAGISLVLISVFYMIKYQFFDREE